MPSIPTHHMTHRAEMYLVPTLTGSYSMQTRIFVLYDVPWVQFNATCVGGAFKSDFCLIYNKVYITDDFSLLG